ncbi:hypothetical protein RclHR1_05730002 [Rhizophagus clarus]|uniref:Kinase-like domain-containing protein n=1 Tax=Rhizophagus clarus TaxID=94130 RepID=A0A2Z6RP20_9GLOM|nr:hypothetical protein RclHR1_05730002 [Rhizophagus clarus]GES91374.1 kinase-like domain-containing protein [Rhizophagus clarus]
MSNIEKVYIDWFEKSIANEHIKYYDYSNFKNIRKIGRGSYGEVSRVTWKNTTFALKSFFKDKHKQTLEEVIKEVRYGVIPYSLVLEYADGSTLCTYLKEHFEELDWNDKYQLALQLANAVEFIHECDIIHRDLHSNNILIHKKNIKLADFGLCKKIAEATSDLKVFGVIPYTDPKSFETMDNNDNYTLNKKSDVYSIGVLMWEISSGCQPFYGKDYNVSLALAIFGGRREVVIGGTPIAYSNLYKDKRPNMWEVVSALNSIIFLEKNYNINGKKSKEDNLSKNDKLSLKSSKITNDIDLNNISDLSQYKLMSNLENIIYSTSSQNITNSAPNITRVDYVQVNNTVIDSSKSVSVLGTLNNIGEAVAPYLPLITAVASLTQQIVKAYESAQYNKKSCAALVVRVQAAEVAVQALNRHKEENEKQFCNQLYYYSFERLVVILREIKEFVQDVTHLSGYKKFISSDHIKERFQQLIIDFDSVVSDLQLAMVIANEEKRKMDIDILQEDINEMTKFLEKIEGGVTTIDKRISNVLKYILTLKDKSSESGFNPTINRIDSNELNEPFGNLTSVSAHNKHRIHKKLYRGQDVACKLIIEEYKPDREKSSEIPSQISNKIHAELAILSNLGKCDYIIKFHGLYEKDGGVFGVFDWKFERTI